MKTQYLKNNWTSNIRAAFIAVLVIFVSAIAAPMAFAMPGADAGKPGKSGPDSPNAYILAGDSVNTGSSTTIFNTTNTSQSLYGWDFADSAQGDTALRATGRAGGIYGVSTTSTHDAASYGIYGVSQGTGMNAAGVYGQVDDNTGTTDASGVRGVSVGQGYGVYGSSPSIGVFGQSTNIGVRASGNGVGLDAHADGPQADAAVLADSDYGPGVVGRTAGGISIFADRGAGVAGINYNIKGSPANLQAGVYGYCPTCQGVLGLTDSSFGVYGKSTSGIGVYGFSSSNIGLYGQTSTGNYALYAVNASKAAGKYAGFFEGNVRINGNYVATGTKSALVYTSQGERLMYAEESTRNYFSDQGTASLEDGHALIRIDPLFAQTVSLDEGYQVFVTPGSLDTLGLGVVKQTPLSFEVGELGKGKGNFSFHWRISALRKGYEKERMSPAPQVAAPLLPDDAGEPLK